MIQDQSDLHATRCRTSVTTGPACTGETAPKAGTDTSAIAHRRDSQGQHVEMVCKLWRKFTTLPEQVHSKKYTGW